MTDYVVVFVTTASVEEARRIASAVIDARLAACVNIIAQVESVYRWRGDICHDRESLLIMKTAREQLAELDTLIKSLHSYEVPEIIALSIEGGSEQYLTWLRESVARA